MMVCRHCGWENPAEAAFCTNCGRGLGRSRSGTVDPGLSDVVPAGTARRFRSLEGARPVVHSDVDDAPIPPLRPPPGGGGRGDAQATLIDFSLQAVLAELRAGQPTDPPAALDGTEDTGEPSPVVPPGDDEPAAAPASAPEPRQTSEPPAEAALATTGELEHEPDQPAPEAEKPDTVASGWPEPKASAGIFALDDMGNAFTPAPEGSEASRADAKAAPAALLAPPTPPPSVITMDEEVVEEESEPSVDEIEPETSLDGRPDPPADSDFDDALEIPTDSVDDEADRLLGDTGDYESVDVEPAPAESPITLPLREEADFEAEEISASDLDDAAAPEAPLLDSGDFEAVSPASARPLPPPLPDVTVRYVLRPLSHNVAAARLIPIGEKTVVIGRGDADVPVEDDRYLSPRHAAFVADDRGLFVEDLDSLNGVWLRVRKDVTLRPGDCFMVGRQLLRVERLRPAFDEEAAADGTRRLGAARTSEGARLVQIGADGGERDVYHVAPEGCRLGRHIADVVFTDDGFMSGTHALVVPRGEVFLLRDLSSRNGTWVRVQGRRPLTVGDAVMLGQTVWRIGQPVG